MDEKNTCYRLTHQSLEKKTLIFNHSGVYCTGLTTQALIYLKQN